MVLIRKIGGKFLRLKDGRETKPGKSPGNSSACTGDMVLKYWIFWLLITWW
jgi:hypothetical protein